MLLPGNLDLLSQTLRGPIGPLVCGFIRRDNLQAWRELVRNPHKGLCKVRMRTADTDGGCGRRTADADNYKIRKIRNDRSFSYFNLRTIACNLYPCELVLIQK